MRHLTIVEVVIPYHMSNVGFGTRDRAPWELHSLYLEALPQVISTLGPNSILLGDFNQRIPTKWVPRQLRDKLITATATWRSFRSEILSPLAARAIDHIAVGCGLTAERVEAISNLCAGKQISDHFGVWAELACSNTI